MKFLKRNIPYEIPPSIDESTFWLEIMTLSHCCCLCSTWSCQKVPSCCILIITFYFFYKKFLTQFVNSINKQWKHSFKTLQILNPYLKGTAFTWSSIKVLMEQHIGGNIYIGCNDAVHTLKNGITWQTIYSKKLIYLVISLFLFWLAQCISQSWHCIKKTMFKCLWKSLADLAQSAAQVGPNFRQYSGLV